VAKEGTKTGLVSNGCRVVGSVSRWKGFQHLIVLASLVWK